MWLLRVEGFLFKVPFIVKVATASAEEVYC